MRFSSGQSVGRYVIESLLGEGGMGEVYRARDSRLERSVALKVLRNDTDGSSEDWEHAVMRMQREARAVAALSHPGIVAIYDIGEHDGVPFIAMELVGGQPLRDLVGKDVPFATRLRILMDVAKALGAAHEAGFVHRDIKPENILVRQDGVPKILDFGIARKTSLNVDQVAQTLDIQGATMDAALVGMTAEGALVGTPAYMSPEQLRGEIADSRSDQFAWGVVAYELLQGKHPFHAEKGAIGLLAGILGETPAPLENVPEAVQSVVMRALEKDPDKRWGSMHEIVQQCESFVTGSDVRKVPDGPHLVSNGLPSQTNTTPLVGKRFSRARWLIAPIVGAAILLAVAALAFRSRKDLTIAPVGLPAANPEPTATAVTALPIPESSSAAAIAEYRQGLQNIRDARWTAAARAFQHARTNDPGMAAAHLRYAMIQFSYDVTSARAAYREAVGLRSALTERDQGFLQAFEPMILREPSDYGEAVRRLEPLVAKYPKDAELVFWLSRMVLHYKSSPESFQRVVDLNTRCVELDPQYADCWQTKANTLMLQGKREAAGVALDECIKVSENSVDCLLDKIDIESHMGHCPVVVEATKQLKTKDPLALNASILFAQALYFSGENESVVRAAFLEGDERARNSGRNFEARMALLMLATDFGDMAGAVGHANYMAHSMTIPRLQMEAALYFIRSALYLEMGKLADAVAVADEFLIARALHPDIAEDLQADPFVSMHAIRLRAGKLSIAEYRKLRADWERAQPKDTVFQRVVVWLGGYAGPAYSRELALEALENRPSALDELPKDLDKFTVPIAAFHGRVLMAAGKYAEAIPNLEKSLRICTSTEPLPWYTQGWAFLGEAREATGDKPGACQAYSKVLSMWGKSKDSLTVKAVIKRAHKLGCETNAGQ